MEKNQNGFSLIELLIVVCVIGIVAAIAIPNLIASRRSANEGSAIATVRTIHSAESTYSATDGKGRYGTLVELGNSNLIDQSIGSSTGVRNGYKFNVEVVNPPTATVASLAIGAVPIAPSGIVATGRRRFCAATDGFISIYVDGNLAASPTSGGDASTPALCESVQ